MKKLLIAISLSVLAYIAPQYFSNNDLATNPTTEQRQYQLVAEAFKQRQSDIQVQDQGKVVKILADDLKGSKHQRFILRVNSRQTVLIAHNIDLAPRIDNLQTGDTVSFLGEYEWNQKGGVVHWTHHDPRGKHIDGWLQHKGKYYQ